MALLIGRKIGLGFALALAALVAVGAVAYENFKATFEDVHWVTHTVEVVLQFETTSVQLKDLESSARGYVLNGDIRFSDDFIKAAAELDHGVLQVGALTADNQVQQERLGRLRPLVAQRRETSRQLMNLRELDSREREQRTIAILKDGTRLSREIQALLDELVEEESRLLRVRQARAAATMADTLSFIVYGTIGAIVLVAGVGLIVTRSITGPLEVLRSGAVKIGQGNYTHRVKIESRDEVNQLTEVFNEMAGQVQERQQQMTDQDWLKSSLTEINRSVQGLREVRTVGEAILG